MNAQSSTTLRRRGLRLEHLTIGWNVVEAVIAHRSRVDCEFDRTGRIRVDSIIEVAAAAVVVWQFRAELRGGVHEEHERRALKLIAVTCFVLAAYVSFKAARTLTTRGVLEASMVGVVLAADSLAVMPTLAWFKRQTALRMGSQTLQADSAETFLCAWLSAILLGGLLLNSTLAGGGPTQ